VRYLSTFLISVLLLVAIPDRSSACTIVFSATEVGPSFLVQVERWGRLVKSLEVTITRDQGQYRMVAETDENGFARFANVPPGHYSVITPHDAGTLELDAVIDVKPGGPADVTISQKWPFNLVSVRSLKGVIRSPEWVPGRTQSSLNFELLSGISAKQLRNFQTDEKGDFDLRDTPPGVYFLDLKPSGVRTWSGSQLAGRIYVSVEPDARVDHLDLSLGWTSCGLHYSDGGKCEPSDLVLGQLSGEVIDPSGSGMRGAQVELTDSSGAPVERLTSDASGRFSLSRPLDGVYAIAISAGGFTTYRGTVRLNPLNPRFRNSGMVAQLGIGGSCSAARSF
jgi:hypothetical protein